jgi:hypothetical protein
MCGCLFCTERVSFVLSSTCRGWHAANGIKLGELQQRTVERSLIRDIIDEKNTHGAAIISRGNGSEAFLAGGIPYLQLDALAVQLDRSDLEVYSNGGDEGRRE